MIKSGHLKNFTALKLLKKMIIFVPNFSLMSMNEWTSLWIIWALLGKLKEKDVPCPLFMKHDWFSYIEFYCSVNGWYFILPCFCYYLSVRYKSNQQTARQPARVGSGSPRPCEMSVFSLRTPARKYCSALEMMLTLAVSSVRVSSSVAALTHLVLFSSVMFGWWQVTNSDMLAPDGIQIGLLTSSLWNE